MFPPTDSAKNAVDMFPTTDKSKDIHSILSSHVETVVKLGKITDAKVISDEWEELVLESI